MNAIDRDALIELLSSFDLDTADEGETADRILALVRPVGGPSAREIADWFEREADPDIPDDWRLRTARTIRHEWDLS